MYDKIIELDTAKLAFEKGFDYPCYASRDASTPTEIDYSVDYNGELWFTLEDMNNAEENGMITYLAPTQSLLRTWLRDVHKIEIEISCYKSLKGCRNLPYSLTIEYILGDNYTWLEYEGQVNFKTYEEALEHGLREALKIVKNVSE